MFGDHNELQQHCSFCSKPIKSVPFYSIDRSLSFCDILCGKLYYDNIAHFTPNIVEYNNLYINNALSVQAREIYSEVSHIMFEMLPRFIPMPNSPEYDNPSRMKASYLSSITPLMMRTRTVK